MAYTTIASLQERVGTLLYARLTDRANGTTANATVAQRIVDEAETELNGALRQRYVVPVDTGGDAELAALLRARALDAAEVHAWKQSPFTNELPNRIQQLELRLREWLDAVAGGRIELPAMLAPVSQRFGAAQAAQRSAPRRFTEDELGRWSPSPTVQRLGLAQADPNIIDRLGCLGCRDCAETRKENHVR